MAGFLWLFVGVLIGASSVLGVFYESMRSLGFETHNWSEPGKRLPVDVYFTLRFLTGLVIGCFVSVIVLLINIALG